jgi:hypothetical protein
MRVLVALMLLGGTAAADSFRDYKGAASLEYEVGYVHAYKEPAPDDGIDGLGLAGARLRGQFGKSWVDYRVGLDLRAGATAPGGFAYDVALYAVGLGVRLGMWSRLGITGGIGASGATGTVDDALTFPVEASLELALGSNLRVLARARAVWLAAARGRENGVRSASWIDEGEASFAVRLGNRWTDWGHPTGNGYYLGVAYREAEGAKMVGAIFGVSLDAGSGK